ncbi:hypothetical protein AAFF_G00227960 [Aldrovandia affinis]|uniref:C2H2-type domain-containing protein n=1 Tax=Aldrovandia affinis TaxID=143900 RepID=A0AAD7TBW7_9TELE|nr:hypothetical protein AAFF_G00227960 [Aldrovandia affinis]
MSLNIRWIGVRKWGQNVGAYKGEGEAVSVPPRRVRRAGGPLADKLEMSGTKEAGAMGAPPSAVATLPDNIKLVSPAPSGKESKAKSKRSKNSKDGGKAMAGDTVAKREGPGRTQGEGAAAGGTGAGAGKATEKSGKPSRSISGGKKDKEAGSGKSKKEKSEGVAVVAVVAAEKEAGSQAAATRSTQFEGAQNTDSPAGEQLGNASVDPGTIPLSAIKTEPDELDHGDGRALKKVKNEKMESPVCTPGPLTNSDVSSACEQIMVHTRSVAVNTSEVALATQPDCLGPCEPGTSVNLEGIVWQETEDGMLVVNVTWRNKTYVGTLLDCTRHDWAPPRFCESPTSDVEMRNGRGRGKRPVRPNSNTPVNENSNSSDNKGSSKTRAGSGSKVRRGSQNAPPTSAGEDAKPSPSPSAAKRKSKPPSDMEPNSSSEDSKGSKRMRPNSANTAPPAVLPEPPPLDRDCPSPALIDCPHPGCGKKYRHAHGLRYHQARAHGGDGEFGEDSALHNGGLASQKPCLSPARCLTPKGRGFDPHSPSPSPGRLGSRPAGKKRASDVDPEGGVVEGEDGVCLTDEASNDGVDDRKCTDRDRPKRPGGGAKPPQRSQKAARPITPATPATSATPAQLYALQTPLFTATSPGSASAMATVVQPLPKSPQLKVTGVADPAHSPALSPTPTPSPALSASKDKKKKRRKEAGKEGDGPKRQEGKSPYHDPVDPESLLNGADPLQSRLASIKAEADKVYSFSDNAPSPSIGATGRTDVPPHMQAQNGADASSPAYSDISDAGEEGEGRGESGRGESSRGESGRSKAEDAAARDAAKKALFPCHTPSKEATYYPSYDTYYSPSYPQPSPGGAPALGEGQGVKVKKEEEEEPCEEERKVEPQEERKVEVGGGGSAQQQASVIQQRPSVYMQPLYYNQYAYVPPYSYHADQAYHAHLMSSSPAYRQQYEERQRQGAERKPRAPPTLSKVPAPAHDPAKPPPAKPKDPEPAKSVIIPKGEEPKAPSQQAEGHKLKHGEGGHHGKVEPKPALDPARPTGVEPAMWYRQEPDSRLWPYVYPSKYPDTPKQQQQQQQQQEEDEGGQRCKDERERGERDRERERERKGRDERPRPKEEGKEGGDARTLAAASEDHRGGAKEPRPPAHMQFTGLPQHQAYVPYMHSYPYGQAYDPTHPGYRAMPSVMMQNYPGSYLSAGYSFSPYGGKMGGEEGEKAGSSPTVAGKSSSEPKALDVLHQHASQYKSKSPTVTHRAPAPPPRLPAALRTVRPVLCHRSVVISHCCQPAGICPLLVPPHTEVRQGDLIGCHPHDGVM